MKIVTVVGARPQFVKSAVLSRIFKGDPSINEILIHTGQHFDKNMSDIFFKEMEIPVPDYNLDINGLAHGAMTGQMLEGIEEILMKEEPDYVMVYGDTNSTIAGALAARKLHISVIHVEAGLRSFNMQMPEEINRILTDRISNMLFCPTQTAVDNLKNEGYENLDCNIVLSGDIMQDAAMFYKEKSADISNIIQTLNLKTNEFLLGTIHRAENTDNDGRLRSIIDALNNLNKIIRVVVPLHPRTAKIIQKKQLKAEFTIIDPVGYFDMLQLISNSKLILTDSGGLQKEAYFFNKYCVTLRDETEWVELIDEGYNVLAGVDSNKIIVSANNFMKSTFKKKSELYGSGLAGENIHKQIIQNFNSRK
jgi:UDP-GlcNAc3NAcA epimerase